jgi:integrase
MNEPDTTTPAKPVRKRRPRGEGSIRERDGRFEGCVSFVHPTTGIRTRKTVTTRTRGECVKLLRKLQTQIDKGFVGDASNTTVKEWCEQWIRETKPLVANGTIVPYQQHTSRFVIPGLGTAKLEKLRRKDIQAFYTWLQTERTVNGVGCKPQSAAMVKKIRTTLNVLLNAAVQAEIIDVNPAQGVKTPKPATREVKTLSIDEAARLVTMCKGERFGALFALMLDTGARPSEAMALLWGDIDFTAARVSIVKALDRYGPELAPKETKTRGSRRTVPVGPQTLALLNDHRAEALRAGRDISPRGIVFANDAGGYMDLSSLHRRHYRPLLRKANLPVFTMYAMRHFAASALMSAGLNSKVVSERMGHSGIALTLQTYSHLGEGMQQEATAVMTKLLAGKAVSGR